MKIHGITLAQGSEVANLVIANGTSFPVSPDEGELFFRTDGGTTVRGLYCYIGGTWDRIASSDSLTAPTGASLPGSANEGDLFYRSSNDSFEGLYVYNGTAWVLAVGSSPSYTITGDVTGTIDGGTDVLTLANSGVTAGTYGSTSDSVTLTINAKGLVTTASTAPIAIAASQTTSGTFADARISQSSVTQHQGSLSLSGSQITSGTVPDARISQSSVTQHEGALSLLASQTTSGTFADARISQSNVTQHQAALTILESQITDGTILARVGGSESISGNWAFNNPVIVATPTNDSHAATKLYVDSIASGVNPQLSVRAATTADITLSGTQTVDGVALSIGDRVLVKDQSTSSQNGVYVVASGAWTRATDFDGSPTSEVVTGDLVFVSNGTQNQNTSWVLITPNPITVGTTGMSFSIFSRTADVVAGAGLSRTGNQIDVGTASTARIVVNADNIDLAAVGTPVTDVLRRITTDAYGRVTGTSGIVSGDLTGILDSVYVNVSGDTMTGNLSVNRSATPTATASVAVTSDETAVVMGAPGSTFGSNPLGFSGSNPYLAAAMTSTSQVFAIGTYGSITSIAFVTQSQERLRISGAGRVTIGAASIESVLLNLGGINSSASYSSGEAILSLRNNVVAPGARGAGIRFDWGTNSNGSAQIDLIQGSGANEGSLSFGTRNSIGVLDERMRIDSNGNIILTNDIRWGTWSSGTSGQAISASTASSGTLQFYTAGTERFRISSDGTAGLGSSSQPGLRFTVSTSSTDVYDGATQNTLNAFYTKGTMVSITNFTNTTSKITRAALLDFSVTDTAGGNNAYIGALAQSAGNGAAHLVFGRRTGISSWAESMRIDGNGNLGINTTTPRARLDVSNPTTTSIVDSDIHIGYSGANFYGYRMVNSNNPSNTAAGVFQFQRGTVSNWATVWDCDNSGNGSWYSQLAVGSGITAGSAPSLRVRSNGGDTLRIYSLSSGNGVAIDCTNSAETVADRLLSIGGTTVLRVVRQVTSTINCLEFQNPNGVVGTIHTTGTSTAYNTSSDERLKKNIVSAPSATTKLNSIQVRSYDWKADDSHVEHGMIAQELHQVLPEAVKVGGEDESRDAWAIDYSKLVPVLTKALQEALARIETLETEVQSLKSQNS